MSSDDSGCEMGMNFQVDNSSEASSEASLDTIPHLIDEMTLKIQAIRMHFRAFATLPIPNQKTTDLWNCAPNTIAHMRAISLLLPTQDTYVNDFETYHTLDTEERLVLTGMAVTYSQPSPPSMTEPYGSSGVKGECRSSRSSIEDSTDSVSSSPSESPLPTSVPPLLLPDPPFVTTAGPNSRSSPYPVCLILNAAQNYRDHGAQSVLLLLQWLLVDYDKKPPARLFSEIMGQLTSNEVNRFKRDLREKMREAFLSVWNTNQVRIC